MSDLVPETKAAPPPQPAQSGAPRETASAPPMDDRRVPTELYEAAVRSIQGQEGQFTSSASDAWDALARNPRVGSGKLIGVGQRLVKFGQTLRSSYDAALQSIK